MNTLLFDVLEADFYRVVKTGNSFVRLVLRSLVGTLFVVLAVQELFGGSHGVEPEVVNQWMALFSLESEFLMESWGSGAMFVSGLVILLGLLTRPTALLLSVTTIVTILIVSVGNGFSTADTGYEFWAATLAMTAMLLALAIQGAGAVSVDRLISHRIDRERILNVGNVHFDSETGSRPL